MLWYPLPMSQDLHSLLSEAVRRGASDLLLVAGTAPALRVHGDLTPADGARPALGRTDVPALLAAVMPERQRGLFDAGGSVDFAFEREGVGRFRCNLHRTQAGVSAALRVLPAEIPDFRALNLPAQAARFSEMVKGFVLVAGPTGSGKSTTISCLIDMINARRPAHIVTIEEPVEYRHRHRRGLVEQIEIPEDSPGFADALRHTLRQDPDVIFVGEMRDLETISIALTAAETGHLVFSTLHTNDTTQAIDRIIDVYPAAQQSQIRMQLSMSLSGVIAQHLIPTLDGKGRVPAVELLMATDAVRNLIRSQKTFQLHSTIGTSKALGMQTLDDALATLVKRQRISREDAVLRSSRPEELAALLR